MTPAMAPPQGILPPPRVRNLSPILLRLRVKNLGLKKDMLCGLRNPHPSHFCCDGRDLSKGRGSHQGQDWWLFFFFGSGWVLCSVGEEKTIYYVV